MRMLSAQLMYGMIRNEKKFQTDKFNSEYYQISSILK